MATSIILILVGHIISSVYIQALSRTKSDAAVPPAAPPFKPPPPHNARTLPGKAINSGVALTEFKELEQHRTGFIFKKKVTIANMLSWTKVRKTKIYSFYC